MTASEGTGVRILIAEDDDHTRNLLCELCESWGYEAHLAADGKEALEQLRRGTDLLLLDLMMPGTDGFSVLSHVRATPRLRELPVIILTAIGDVDGKIRGIELGADDYITKPFRISDLQRRILATLDKRRYRNELKSAVAAPAAEGESFSRLKADLEREAELARQSGRLLAAMLVAIDEDPLTQPSPGRAALEESARRLWQLLRNSFRDSDRLYRLDDEAFLVLMPDTDSEGATRAAERLLRAAAEGRKEPPAQLSFSMGIAECSGQGLAKPDELIRAANDALHQAQRAGTSRIGVAARARPGPG